jgi:uncharacterized protein YecE (DUF72 family)
LVTPKAAALWIGTSGYAYRHWRGGVFYPPGLRAADELAWYASRFRTVELNNPFYRVPTVETVARWRDSVPEDFLFAVKVNREITHARRLRAAEPLGEFLRRAEVLGSRLGPLLLQLPPQLRLDPALLEEFLSSLTTAHRWVIEFRHPSWQVPSVYDALGRRAVALCVPVGGPLAPDLVPTAPFTYVRMHAGARPDGAFDEAVLRTWAARLRALVRSGKDVYVYFNNDRAGHAPHDAARLTEMLGAKRQSSGVSDRPRG